MAGLSVGLIDHGKVVATKAEINEVTTKLIVYEGITGREPTQEQGLQALVEKPVSGAGAEELASAPGPLSGGRLEAGSGLSESGHDPAAAIRGPLGRE